MKKEIPLNKANLLNQVDQKYISSSDIIFGTSQCKLNYPEISFKLTYSNEKIKDTFL